MDHGKFHAAAALRSWATVLLPLLALGIVGCSGSQDSPPSGDPAPAEQDDAAALLPPAVEIPSQPPPGDAPSPTPRTVPLEIPVPLPPVEIDPNAPTVGQTYPRLSSSALVEARLMELPEGTLLRTADVAIQQGEIDSEIAEVPEMFREQLRKNAFFMMEQLATQRLLAQEARALGQPGDDEEELFEALFEKIVAPAEVSDQEVSDFYDENVELVEGAPLEDVAPQIRRFLLQEKQQELVNQHVLTLGRRTPIAVAASWVAEQAKQAADNPVDQGRDSGIPTFVSFGADSCAPCQAMAPIREELREKYEGRVNVVYVHVDQDQILASRYGVQGIPHLIFFDKDGDEALRHTGVMTQEQIEEELTRLGVE